MGGFNIGIGVGLKYPSPINKRTNSKPPEEDILDALIMEDGSLFMMEDGSYFKIEVVQAKRSSRKSKSTTKVDKSYWNF